MGAFGGLVLTIKGRNLQAKAQAGADLKYSRMGLGDGTITSQSIPSLVGLISQRKSLNLNRVYTPSPARAVVSAILSNQDVTTGFFFREIGVFALDPDEGEILYAYGNSGTTAEYIPPAGSADIIEKLINLNIIVGNATNVTAVIDQSLVYATRSEFENKINEINLAIDEMQDEINSFSSHLTNTNNPHKVTTEQVNTIASKLVAEMPAVYPIGITAFSLTTALADPWKTATGHVGTDTALVQTTKMSGDYLIVQRITFNNGGTGVTAIYERSTSANNVWNGAWKKVVSRSEFETLQETVTAHKAETATLTTKGHVKLNSSVTSPSEVDAATPKAVKTAMDRADAAFLQANNGKTAVASAVTAKGVAASPSDTFPTLATKIGQISSTNVKSIQRGSTFMADVSENVPISLVDITKAIVKITFRPNSTAGQGHSVFVKAQLSNSTTLNLSLSQYLLSNAPTVEWEVIEFSNVKSLQTGTAAIGAVTTSVAVAAVNTLTSLLFFSYTSSSGSAASQTNLLAGSLSSGVNISFSQVDTSIKSVYWQVIEFN
ncbi:tail fiber protein [Paenibacillus macquariensis]|uniref:Phage tail-collar fibre protein n=1 Tax=Paenibacillus macquariensis TaxID=948756 RepID=A0ABY1K765_9BACL|nr:tail fiber protein [Paenibacillus macquariensis]MEC0092511.1 tail fiber protein [Paenibacillus macquariensis]OAB35469.1 hypothetical protein PMSM_09440 [Paenibacillus macquariensis subsp. macquariensis]SIR35218.1 Phage tail-collar fibre protein [Paenibacillus macquariensis]